MNCGMAEQQQEQRGSAVDLSGYEEHQVVPITNLSNKQLKQMKVSGCIL